MYLRLREKVNATVSKWGEAKMHGGNHISGLGSRSRLSDVTGYGLIITLATLLLTVWVSDASALTIIRNYMGGNPQPTAIGGGNLVDIFNAAADQWEQAIHDDHVLVLNYGWAPIGGGNHTLNRQGGSPNRETEGTILFNNNTNLENFQWWLDATPRENEEFQVYEEVSQDFGGGAVNVSRIFTNPVGEYANGFYIDLFSIALHEIGHALGKSLANVSWKPECEDGTIHLQSPRPYAGSVIPLATNLYGVTSHFHPTKIHGFPAMGASQSRTRQVLSALDILANAQISQFAALNLNPLGLAPVPSHVSVPNPSFDRRLARAEHNGSKVAAVKRQPVQSFAERY